MVTIGHHELIYGYIYRYEYSGPSPPSGGTHSIIWYGSRISQVLQWTQFEKSTWSFFLPWFAASSMKLYTCAVKNLSHGFPYSSVHFVTQWSGANPDFSGSTRRWHLMLIVWSQRGIQQWVCRWCSSRHHLHLYSVLLDLRISRNFVHFRTLALIVAAIVLLELFHAGMIFMCGSNEPGPNLLQDRIWLHQREDRCWICRCGSFARFASLLESMMRRHDLWSLSSFARWSHFWGVLQKRYLLRAFLTSWRDESL